MISPDYKKSTWRNDFKFLELKKIKEALLFLKTKINITIKSSIFDSVFIQNLSSENFDLLDQICLKEVSCQKQQKTTRTIELIIPKLFTYYNSA